SHLMDPQLMDFAHLKTTGQADDGGDHAFDVEDFAAPAFSEDEDEEAPIDGTGPVHATSTGMAPALDEHVVVRARRRTAETR
ncbi:MAG TPA: hypothetical protein VHK04_09970, partial [Castellaniella sp.]|nr:hypothetical protein [Castellaniella sp.]